MFPANSPAGADRGHIEWRTNNVSGARRRTLLRVYVEAGEYVLLGSSATGVGNGDIVVYNPGTVTGQVANETLPGTPNFTCSTDRPGTGFIASRTQELAGPRSIDGTSNTDGYIPCWFQATTTGVYFVAMYGTSGGNTNGNGSNSPDAGAGLPVNSINTSNSQRAAVSAWDVTVRGSQSTIADRTGRLYTYHVALNMGGNGFQLFTKLYPITTDGYRYEIDIRGLDPFGFRIFGNQLGNLDSDGQTPLYRDVLGSNGDVGGRVGGTSTAPPQYPIFFNQASPSAISSLTVYNPLTGNPEIGQTIPGAPILPEVSSPSFSGNITDNRSAFNQGGTFNFSSNLTSGTFQVVVSYDGINFDPTLPANRVIRGTVGATGGPSSAITWDGTDNDGNPFPVGAYSYKVEVRGGEYHFPLSDAENNLSGGPTYRLLNAVNPLGNTTAFFDHRAYRTLNGTIVSDNSPSVDDLPDSPLCGRGQPSPAATDMEIGADSSVASFNTFGFNGSQNAVNTNSRCTGAFGDTKTLDLWTYVPSNRLQRELIIEDTTDQFDYGDAPDTSAGNGTGDYSTLNANNGPRHTLGTAANPTPKLYLGTGVVTDTDGFVDGTDDNGNATDDSDNAFTAIADLTPGAAYALNDISVVNNTANTATLHAWVDFNQNGQFEAGEYTSSTVPAGATTTNLSWTAVQTQLAATGTTYARFRLTTDATLVDTAATTAVDERSLGLANDGEVEDYAVKVEDGDPVVLLVKRITALNGGTQTTDGHDLSAYRNEGSDPNDDTSKPWPTPLTTFLVGGTDGGTVLPNDTVEYTIYFLSSGDRTAERVRFCDYVPTYTEFVADGFNGNPTATGGLLGADLSVEVFQNGSSTYHTGANDGDAVVYFPPGVNPASDSRFTGITCGIDGNANPNGAIAVDLGNITNASSATNVTNESYGYVRFRARVR